MFRGKYCFNLNSEDIYSPDLPLAVRKAHGGTMALWKTNLDPFIRALPTTSPAVLAVESQPSASLSVSLSTSRAPGRTTSSVCPTLVRSSSATRREPSVSPLLSGTSRPSASPTPPSFSPGSRATRRRTRTRPGSSRPQFSLRFITRKLEQTLQGLESSRVTR